MNNSEQGTIMTRWSIRRNHRDSLLRTSNIFLWLPPELRAMILEHVDPKYYPALRQTCALFKWDIEEIVGVEAVIVPKPKRDPIDVLRLKLAWLRSVLVRSLRLLHQTGKPGFGDIELKNPFKLQRLVLDILHSELRKPEQVEGLTRLLNTCHGLRVLGIGVIKNDNAPLNRDFIYFLTLTCLGNKPYLKHFSFGTFYYPVSGPIVQFMPDPQPRPQALFPMKLSSLDLFLHILSRKQFLDWAAILDSQDQLRSVSLNFRHASWHLLFESLEKSAATLKTVHIFTSVPRVKVFKEEDLRLEFGRERMSFNVPETAENAVNPNTTWLDLSVLARAKLEDLMIVSYDYFQVGGIPTRNFSTIQLTNLRKLALHALHLSIDDLTQILMDGVNLDEVEINHWNSVPELENADFCLVQSIRIWILVSIVLLSRPFNVFQVWSESLRSSPRSIAVAVQETVTSRTHQDLSFDDDDDIIILNP